MSLSNRTITGGKPYSDAFNESSTQEFELGTLWAPNNDPLGRKYRYSLNGAAALDEGKLIQSKQPNANHQEHLGGASTTATAGTKTIVIGQTMTTAMTLDEFRGGTVTFNLATGLGQIYAITANTASATPTITLAENIVTAGDTTTEFTFAYNPYHKVIVLPTTQTEPVVGVARFNVTAANYFWLQTAGYAAVLVDTADTLVIGSKVGVPASGAVAGAAGIPFTFTLTEATPNTLNALTNFQEIGTVISIGTAAEYATIDLKLDR